MPHEAGSATSEITWTPIAASQRDVAPSASDEMNKRDKSSRLAIRLLATACVIGGGVALVGWLWPSGLMEVPLAAVSIAMLLRGAAAVLLAMLTLGMLVAVWSGDSAETVNCLR